MRAKSLLGLMIMGFSLFLVLPAITTGQPGSGIGRGGFSGGGIKFGGGGGMMSMGDPSQIFDLLSRGRGFFLLTDTRSLRDPLTKYAQDKGISNGQISKTQFLDFYEGFKAKMSAPPGGGTPSAPAIDGGGGQDRFKGMFGGNKGGPQMPPGAGSSPEALNEWADKEFQRRDNNGDGRLNQDEMQSSLRSNLTTWDKNGDGFITIGEFRDYFRARVAGTDNPGDPNAAAKGIAAIIIDDDELDRKPVVFRVGGKMPPNLPAWFKELDTDVDGQVAFAEWRRGGKNLDEFRNWDMNDDAFITPEEASKHYATLGKNNKAGPGGSLAGGGGERPSFGGRPQADGASGERPAFGGFGKGKKNRQ